MSNILTVMPLNLSQNEALQRYSITKSLKLEHTLISLGINWYGQSCL
jgi:hypothetical protein